MTEFSESFKTINKSFQEFERGLEYFLLSFQSEQHIQNSTKNPQLTSEEITKLMYSILSIRESIDIKIHKTVSSGKVSAEVFKINKSSTADTVGQNLHLLRSIKSYSIEEFAAKLKITESQLQDYENGNQKPNLNDLMYMAEILDVNINVLLFDTTIVAFLVITSNSISVREGLLKMLMSIIGNANICEDIAKLVNTISEMKYLSYGINNRS